MSWFNLLCRKSWFSKLDSPMCIKLLLQHYLSPHLHYFDQITNTVTGELATKPQARAPAEVAAAATVQSQWMRNSADRMKRSERTDIDKIGRKLAVYGTYICNRQHQNTAGHICSFLVCPNHDKPYSQTARPEISITLTNQEARKQRSVYLAGARFHPNFLNHWF